MLNIFSSTSRLLSKKFKGESHYEGFSSLIYLILAEHGRYFGVIKFSAGSVFCCSKCTGKVDI